MHTPKWLALIASGLATALTACNAEEPPAPVGCDDPVFPDCECAGKLEITVELADLPARLRAAFNGELVFDDCLGQQNHRIFGFNTRMPHALYLNKYDIGYTPPSTISLELFDQGDCSGPEQQIFSVTDVPVEFPHMCAANTVFFAASAGCYSDEECDKGLTCSAETECLPPPNCGDDPCPEVCYGYCVAS